jgi:hypothetical protein
MLKPVLPALIDEMHLADGSGRVAMILEEVRYGS